MIRFNDGDSLTSFSYTPNNGSNPAYPFGGGGSGVSPGVFCYNPTGAADNNYAVVFGAGGYPTFPFNDGYYFRFSYFSGVPVPDPGPPGLTAILTVTPPDDPTFSNARATSTAFAFEATGAVFTDDYVDGMTLTMKYSNDAGIPSNAVAGPLFSTGGNALCNWMPDWLCPPTPVSRSLKEVFNAVA